MSSSLKQQTVSGMIWSSFQRFGTMGINFLSNIVLARLLSPDDFGCIGMLTIFMVIADTFINGGFGAAIIQKRDVSHEDYCTVFYWNIFISVLFYILIYISAPIISQFYDIPILTKVLRVQALVLFSNALSIIQINVLRKNLQFKKLSIIQLFASSIAVLLAIYLAYNGYGVWSLVIQQIVLSVIVMIGLWLLNSWRPSMYFSHKSFIELFGYGSFLLLSDLLNNICDNLQGLIIGKKFCAEELGLYTQAKKLETVPTSSISYVVNLVAFPVYSSLQYEKVKLYSMVRKSLCMMNFINIPLMMLLIIIAEPLIIFLLSDKWVDAIPYFRILCISGLFNCIQSVNYQVVCAMGKSKIVFKWNIIKRIIGIGLIVIGMSWGVKGILYGMVTSFTITTLINIRVATPFTDYSLQKQIKDILPILLIAIFSSLLTGYLFSFFDFNNLISILLRVLVFSICYLLISKFFNSYELEEYVKILTFYKNKL